jgi:hypothetical protein
VNEWQVEIEFRNSIFYTWKGKAVNSNTALERAKESAGLEAITGEIVSVHIKLLTKRGDV